MEHAAGYERQMALPWISIRKIMIQQLSTLNFIMLQTPRLLSTCNIHQVTCIFIVEFMLYIMHVLCNMHILAPRRIPRNVSLNHIRRAVCLDVPTVPVCLGPWADLPLVCLVASGWQRRNSDLGILTCFRRASSPFSRLASFIVYALLLSMPASKRTRWTQSQRSVSSDVRC